MLTFENLQDLVERFTTPGRSNLYRDLYGMKPNDPPKRISSWADWHALPILEKDFLRRYSFAERTFIPLRELDHVRASSGTSGKEPLFCARTFERGAEYRLNYHNYKKPILAFVSPMMPHWYERFFKAHGLPGRVIVFDPHQPEISIKLAKQAGVDAISVFTFQVPRIGALMSKVGMNENIRSLNITGEHCSQAQLSYIEKMFPNAVIYETYGANELDDPDTIPCRPTSGAHPLPAFHAKPSHYIEILDRTSGTIREPKAGVEGDLVISTYNGEPCAFPLIRLRLGDMVRVEAEHCAVHGSWSYQVLGRSDYDFVRVEGGMLRADEVERVLTQFSDRVSDNFTLYVRDVLTETGPRVAPILEVEQRDSTDLYILARDIEQKLRINPTTTWAEGIQKGRFLPLECRPFEGRPGTAKHRRVVRT